MKNNQKWGFTVTNREIKPPRAARNDDKLPELGRHVVELVDFRLANGKGQNWFWIEMKVVEGPSPKDFLFNMGYCPEQSAAKAVAANPKTIYSQVLAKEYGKLVTAVGTFYGFNSEQADANIGDDEVGNAFGKPDIGVKSKFSGRLLVVDHVSWVSKNLNEHGENKRGTNYNFFPYLVDGVSPYYQEAEKPSIEQLLLKHGFEYYPDNTSFVHNGKTGLSVEEFLETYQ